MKLVKMWQLFAKPHEEITACYAKILSNYKPLKCRCMAVNYGDDIILYHSPKECVCGDDGVEYTVKNVSMMTEDDNYFIIYVEVK
jgi:hypothetical protein|nr:MAG TPA: hypothetical protein [Caudoviricetes sp.]